MWVCFKTEKLRWGSPTATTPFEPLVQPLAFIPRSLSLPKGPGSFVRNERRIWKPTLNGISCLTSLKCKRRNNVLIVNMYLKNLCLRFKLVKICNKKLCAPPQERTVAHASGSERIVLIPCFPVLIRGYSSASAYSSFRVFPCSSVANASAFWVLIPWQMLLPLQMNNSRFSCGFCKCIQYP